LQASKENLLEIQRLQNRSTASKDVGSAKEQIDEYDKYKGMLKAKVSEVEKSKIEAAFAVAKEGAHEIELLQLESAKKLTDAKLEMNQKNIQEDGRATAQNLEIYKNKAISIASETSEKIKQIHAKRMIAEYEESVRIQQEITNAEVAESNRRQAIRIANQAQTREMEFQKESLDLKYKMIYATEQEQRLAQISLEYARKRKEVEEGPDKQFNLDQIDRQQQMAEMFVVMQESAKRTQQVFDSVFGNLSSAIDNFVKTGKLNMKDLARSVIQDLIAIQMKAAAMRFLNAAFGIATGGSGSNDGWFKNVYQATAATPKAAGGSVTNNTPYMVGERGPELFVPSGSGTIIPNGQVGSMASTTNVTNNYINAIDTKSFEDRLLGSSNAVWAANQYANKSLAVSRGRS
jgi:lambda family phage tail tape measure protein